MSLFLPTELVKLVDQFAKDVTPLEPERTRTDAIRILLIEALKERGYIK